MYINYDTEHDNEHFIAVYQTALDAVIESSRGRAGTAETILQASPNCAGCVGNALVEIAAALGNEGQIVAAGNDALRNLVAQFSDAALPPLTAPAVLQKQASS